jgi:lipopolysaccharide/colanic/teichoic acid biosynthesis glycosyltransferase
MVRLDCEYVQHRSLRVDLKIIALTVPAVITGKGAG